MCPFSSRSLGCLSSVQNMQRSTYLSHEQRRERLEVAGGGALADHDKLAALELGNGVVELGALVVGVDARGDVGVEVVALEAGRVAVDLLVVRLRGDNFLHDLRVGVDRADEIHHLGQPLHARIVIEAVDGAVVEVRARLVERRGGHTARQHEAARRRADPPSPESYTRCRRFP